MSSGAYLNQETALAETLAGIVKAYEEIAVMKMQASREQVLSNRFFMIGLSDIFLEIQAAYLAEQAGQPHKKDEPLVFQYSTFRRDHQKPVAALITPSRRLAGNIVNEVFDKFIHWLEANPEADTVVIGRTGYDRFGQVLNREPMRFFDLDPAEPDTQKWQPVIDLLATYQQVEVFFGTFVNLMTQVGTEVNLTGQKPETDPTKTLDRTILKQYIFEPSVHDILQYFETQVFGTFLRIIGQEAFLSEMGSRVTAMERATSKIERRRAELRWQARRQKHRQSERDKFTVLAGRTLWHNLG